MTNDAEPTDPISASEIAGVADAVDRLLALLDEEGKGGESARETFSRLGKDRCAAPLKDLLEESPGCYVEEDFFDLGVSSPEVFPAVTAGNRAP